MYVSLCLRLNLNMSSRKSALCTLFGTDLYETGIVSLKNLFPIKAMNQAKITLELVDFMQYDEKRKREKGQ